MRTIHSTETETPRDRDPHGQRTPVDRDLSGQSPPSGPRPLDRDLPQERIWD